MDLMTLALLKKAGGSGGGGGGDTKPLVVNKATHLDFPSIGDVNVIYKAEQERLLYQWDAENLKYVTLSGDYVTEQQLENGEIAIKIADSDTTGVVKSTSAENGVSVSADGSMSINSISIDKITQDEENPIVLFGGNA